MFNFSLIGVINTASARAYTPQPAPKQPNGHIPFNLAKPHLQATHAAPVNHAVEQANMDQGSPCLAACPVRISVNRFL
jgi:hypothetical protein